MSSGRDTERQALGILEECGYEVYQPPKAKYREQDVFGVYDLLAFGHGRLLAVQVKGSQDARGINDWFEETQVYDEHLPGWRSQFWHRKDGHWRIAVRVADGYEWAYDGRDAATAPYTRLPDLLIPEEELVG